MNSVTRKLFLGVTLIFIANIEANNPEHDLKLFNATLRYNARLDQLENGDFFSALDCCRKAIDLLVEGEQSVCAHPEYTPSLCEFCITTAQLAERIGVDRILGEFYDENWSAYYLESAAQYYASAYLLQKNDPKSGGSFHQSLKKVFLCLATATETLITAYEEQKEAEKILVSIWAEEATFELLQPEPKRFFRGLAGQGRVHNTFVGRSLLLEERIKYFQHLQKQLQEGKVADLGVPVLPFGTKVRSISVDLPTII